VSTDDGPQSATKFFVNGEEPTRRVVTEGGYSIQGTYAHRVKVVDPVTGAWEWKRLMDIAAGDVVPVQMDTLVGEPRRVPLPVLDEAYYAGDRGIVVPDAVDTDLAELVGYFMATAACTPRASASAWQTPTSTSSSACASSASSCSRSRRTSRRSRATRR
jgi:ribonucleoside-diphosphate reductase alpha chain